MILSLYSVPNRRTLLDRAGAAKPNHVLPTIRDATPRRENHLRLHRGAFGITISQMLTSPRQIRVCKRYNTGRRRSLLNPVHSRRRVLNGLSSGHRLKTTTAERSTWKGPDEFDTGSVGHEQLPVGLGEPSAIVIARQVPIPNRTSEDGAELVNCDHTDTNGMDDAITVIDQKRKRMHTGSPSLTVDMQPTDDFAAWLSKVVEGRNDEVIRACMALCWSIWKGRNDMLWNNKPWTPSEVGWRAVVMVEEWNALSTAPDYLGNQRKIHGVFSERRHETVHNSEMKHLYFSQEERQGFPALLAAVQSDQNIIAGESNFNFRRCRIGATTVVRGARVVFVVCRGNIRQRCFDDHDRFLVPCLLPLYLQLIHPFSLNNGTGVYLFKSGKNGGKSNELPGEIFPALSLCNNVLMGNRTTSSDIIIALSTPRKDTKTGTFLVINLEPFHRSFKAAVSLKIQTFLRRTAAAETNGGAGDMIISITFWDENRIIRSIAFWRL
nr:uncharacterized protein LOC109160848 [Ipomoea batatas]